MIPPILTRPLRLHPSILNGKHIRKHTPLIHRHAEQLSAIPGAGPQLLARRPHGLPLSLELELALLTELGLVEVPGAVDRPVAEVAGSREAERTRREGVPEEVAD